MGTRCQRCTINQEYNPSYTFDLKSDATCFCPQLKPTRLESVAEKVVAHRPRILLLVLHVVKPSIVSKKHAVRAELCISKLLGGESKFLSRYPSKNPILNAAGSSGQARWIACGLAAAPCRWYFFGSPKTRIASLESDCVVLATTSW